MRDPAILLFGGTSSERRVSVASAQNLLPAFDWTHLWYVDPEGAVHDCPRRALADAPRPFEQDLEVPSGATWGSIEAALASQPALPVLFLALHGGDGENGVLQRRLENRGVAFTGSGSTASPLAFDKVAAKARVATVGLRVAEHATLSGEAASVRQALQSMLARHRRVVAKPVADGSSVGLHFVSDAAGVELVVEAVSEGTAYLAEPFVSGRELTVAVVEEGAAPVALPATEVVPEAGRSFDYAGKYLGAGVKELTPAPVPAGTMQAAQQAALAAHRCVGCRGYSRTDMILGPEGLTFLEVNTLPGLTRASFVPQQLRATGRQLAAFVVEQLRIAVLAASH